MRSPRVLVLLLGLAVAGAAVVAVVLLTTDDGQSKVEVRRGDPLPSVQSLNRADDYGADVVRAYLRAALTCSPAGDRGMAALSRPGETAARKIMRDACARTDGRPFADGLTAEVAQEDLDQRGRSLWRATASGGELPADLILRVRQSTNGWEIDRPCTETCPP
jgi:hypothetical protein